MNVSLYQAASALNATDRWQETIADNLASSSIPGFKKQDFSFAAVQAGLLPSGPGHAAGGARHLQMPLGVSATNFRPGELRPSPSKTDLAIEGPGFFEVQLPNGATAYTRDGEFQINASGQLVTKEGNVVLGEAGPIQLDTRNSAPLSISPTGDVSQGADLKGKIKLVEFSDQRLLTQISGGYFTAGHPNLSASASAASRVRQGFLEGANTSVVLEMANLMTAMRTFEANQRMVQIQDDRTSKAIGELSPG